MNVAKTTVAVVVAACLSVLAATVSVGVGVAAHAALTAAGAGSALAESAGAMSGFAVAFVLFDWATDGRATRWLNAQ